MKILIIIWQQKWLKVQINKIPTSLSAQLFILLATLTSGAVTADPSAKLDELMTPVDAATYDRLYQNNEFAIRQQLYFAKKHKIVKINTDLLMQNSKPFSITPFNDIKFKILAGHKVAPINQQTLIWDGQLSFPRINTDDEEINQHLNEVTLYLHAGSMLYDPDKNPAINGIGQSPQTMQVAFRKVNGEIRNRLGKKKVIIYVLPFNPDYNLIYLQDRTKLVGEGYDNANERSGKLDRFLKELYAEKANREQKEIQQ